MGHNRTVELCQDLAPPLDGRCRKPCEKTYETEIDGSDPTAGATFSYKAFPDRLDGVSWC